LSPQTSDSKNPYTQGESGYGSQPSGDSPPEGATSGSQGDLEGALDKEISEQMSKDLEDKMQNMTLDKIDDDGAETTLELGKNHSRTR
jgi:hypothetical protein